MRKHVEAVVFGTRQLEVIRGFYEDVLQFEIARYVKASVETADVTATHVNYVVDGLLVGFEASDRTDTGGLVLQVGNLAEFRALLGAEVAVQRSTDWFFVVHDPDDRELIIESRRT